MRKSLNSIFLAVLIFAGAGVAQAQGVQLKVGFFDPQRLTMETAEGKRVQAQLEAIRDQKQSEILGKETEIKDLQNTLQQQSLSLSADRRASIEMDIQKKMMDLENASNLAGRELQLEVAQAQGQFNDKLLQGVESFGRKESFDLLLDTSTIAWANQSLDVTTALIDHFDALFPPAGTPAAGE